MVLNKRFFFEYLLMYLLLMVSGNPLLMNNKFVSVFIFFIFFIFFIKKRKKIDKEFLFFFFFSFFLFLVQYSQFSVFPEVTIFGFYIYVLTAYFAIKILSENFIKRYIIVMYALSLLSLIFYVPIISGLIDINTLHLFSINTSDASSNFPRLSLYGLFTYIKIHFHRNCGPFWEPGAFVGYLLIAFMFNYFTIQKNRKKITIVLLITILTTQSTTGYTGLFIFFLFIYLKKVKYLFVRLLILATFIVGGIFLYNTFDFLGKKVDSQIKSAIQTKNFKIGYDSNRDTQRFLNMLRDIKDFEGYEIFGRGLNPKTRYQYNQEEQIRTVGLTDIFVKFGVPFVLFMLFYLYYSIKKYLEFQNQYHILDNIGIFIVIIVLLLSEIYFNLAFFWCLIFLFLIYKNQKHARINNVIKLKESKR